MKKTIIIILSLVIVSASLLSACSDGIVGFGQSTSAVTADGESEKKIRELEAKISAILEDHQLSAAESKKEIEKLRAQLEELISKQATEKPSEAQSDAAESKFSYVIANGVATITSIDSDEENIVIPYVIDGYKVYSISSEAISSKTLRSVVVSAGIEKIDWFAFKNCPLLQSVTIPDTVHTIGYGAFEAASSAFVIRCSKDSFAHRYAQSYGITYDLT